MTEQEKPNGRPSADGRREQKTNSETDESKTYVYESAGIYERKGTIPWFLILVAVGLIVWGVYYLIYYWRPPT